eukprot:m.137170 g.137170  ORF g.137170 m.137170 type:complete len:380 (-) comp29911_c0_seq1:171-1310(-)
MFLRTFLVLSLLLTVIDATAGHVGEQCDRDDPDQDCDDTENQLRQSTTDYAKDAKAAAKTLADTEKYAQGTTLPQVLAQSAQSSLKAGPTFTDGLDADGNSEALQLFHIALLQCKRVAPWKSPQKKAGTKNKKAEKNIPFSIVKEFHKKYQGTQYLATLFPDKSDVVSTVDIVYPRFCRDAQVSFTSAAVLNGLVRKNKMKRTAEIGCACGFSAATIAQALSDVKSEKGKVIVRKHFAIDPAAMSKTTLQKQGYDGVGKKVIENLGLGEYFELKVLPSHTALPKLLEEFGEESFQMIFIDGMHLFDYIMLESYYADLLLEVGGFLVFDDSQMVATQRAVMFIMRNRHYVVSPSLHVDPRITVLKKVKNDDREWYHHRAF